MPGENRARYKNDHPKSNAYELMAQTLVVRVMSVEMDTLAFGYMQGVGLLTSVWALTIL